MIHHTLLASTGTVYMWYTDIDAGKMAEHTYPQNKKIKFKKMIPRNMTNHGRDVFSTSLQWEDDTGHTSSSCMSSSQERTGVHSVILEPHPTLLNHLNEPHFPQSSLSLDQMWPSPINREQASWFCQPSHTLPYFKITKIAMPSSL